MKNNKNTPQQKNFYFALYASIAAIALVAAIATYSNLHSLSNKFSLAQNKNSTGDNPPPQYRINTDAPNQNQSEYQSSQQNILVEPVSNNQSQSYLDKKNQLAKSSEPKSIKNYLTPSDRRQNVNSDTKNKLTDDTKKSAADVLKMPQTPNSTPAEKNFPKNESQQNEIQKENSSSNSQTAVFTSDDDEQNFTGFDENQKMAWPVFGQIVMNFDDKNLVYDKTLEQYRTNDCISLAADVGQQVKASADGIVKLITKTNEGGNTIVIDHGNNWSTTYSQLQDDLLVNEGDFVKKGQAIGGVNKPTKYGVLLGNHLDFKITHNDVSVNPKDVMTKNQ